LRKIIQNPTFLSFFHFYFSIFSPQKFFADLTSINAKKLYKILSQKKAIFCQLFSQIFPPKIAQNFTPIFLPF